MSAEEHYVYYCYDRHGEVIYVGMTYRLRRRLAEHRKRSKWWPDVAAMIPQASYAARDDAINAERRAIRKLLPRHNRYRFPDKEVARPSLAHACC